jgi:SHS2 domain-containing protein
VAHGEKYDKARHRAGTYIKAVTYHQLSVQRTPEGWKATVYLDV